MHLKTAFSLAAASTLLLAGSLTATALARPSASFSVAQAAAPAMTREQNDAQMTACSRYRAAFHRLDGVRAELTQLQSDFAPTDDIRPKLDALVTQTNDAMMTSRARAEGCPAKHK